MLLKTAPTAKTETETHVTLIDMAQVDFSNDEQIEAMSKRELEIEMAKPENYQKYERIKCRTKPVWNGDDDSPKYELSGKIFENGIERHFGQNMLQKNNDENKRALVLVESFFCV